MTKFVVFDLGGVLIELSGVSRFQACDLVFIRQGLLQRIFQAWVFTKPFRESHTLLGNARAPTS